ncbi:MAG: nucleotidyl transferase [Tessaracoccus sp.]|uniref:DUF6036 family nucleotidyltransferase n=1 Tax=Tessaracoccus sp. TaxID=1971211 RepID=UPI001ED3A6A0|nr:DUF6036 family nucleotidyltransferase [Tessaracoccus sp.]MBK7822749.1 nucleotidyl transferase [Tessaracoccus sp.]
MTAHDRNLTRDEILSLLREVGEILVGRDVEASVYVVGGAAIALEFDARRITRDVDAAVRSGGDEFWRAVATVAEAHELSPDWVNSRATAFFSNEPDPDSRELTLPGLRIAVASPHYLVAMKLRAMRRRDLDDLEVLFRHLGFTSPEQAAAIHDEFFDESYMGYNDPQEALYAAQRVFDRAAARGNPLT